MQVSSDTSYDFYNMPKKSHFNKAYDPFRQDHKT